MGAQYGKLNVEGRVEHHVGSFLIGEYPLVLGQADVLPLRNGLLGSIGAFVIVADDTAQQSVVARGNPVVVIERDASEGRDIDLVRHVVGNLFRQQRVQGMDALDNQHRIARQLELLAVILAFARHEIIFGYFHFLALHQPQQMILEQGIFHRLDVVEIVVTVGQLRGVHAIDEIVVGRVHYKGWPDHGAPTIDDGYKNFLYMIKRVDELKGDTPIVVHCSAGVGRTGTFISIYLLYNEIMAQIKNENLEKIDFSVFNIVRKLKEMRLYMVQSIDQYKFIYEFIDCLLRENNK